MRVNVLGCPIDALTMAETLTAIEGIIANKCPIQHVVVNAAKMVAIRKDERFRRTVINCPMINADGQSVVWAARLLKQPLPERVTGIDLMTELIRISAQKGYRVFFLGATETINSKVVSIMQHKYPALEIVGARNGYWNQDENEKVVDKIRASGADILFVGISSPKKEYWLEENLHKLGVSFCMGVGGSFDVIAGATKRAPLWMQRIGMEWFYRFMQEPRRMWKRYLIGNMRFMGIVLKEWITITLVRLPHKQTALK